MDGNPRFGSVAGSPKFGGAVGNGDGVETEGVCGGNTESRSSGVRGCWAIGVVDTEGKRCCSSGVNSKRLTSPTRSVSVSEGIVGKTSPITPWTPIDATVAIQVGLNRFGWR